MNGTTRPDPDAAYPITDHCDGRRFFNPAGRPQARSFSELPRWWWQRLRGQGSRWPAPVPAPRRPVLPPSVPAGHVAATFVGHATFLLQLPGLNVLTDPVFAARAGPFDLLGPRRVRPPALEPAGLPPIGLVLLSHCHYDHLDLTALRHLTRAHRPAVVTTLGNRRWLEARGVERVVELDWWQEHRVHDGVTVACTPAQHFAARTLWDRNLTLWGGLVLRTGHGTIYFAGDSGWTPAFAEVGARLGPFDLSLLPIGAYEPRWFMESVHMNPDEAVRAHLAVRSRRSLGMHFGTFQLTDEAIDAPLHELAEARRTHGVTPEAFDTLDFGETRLIGLGRENGEAP
ncbi:MAG: MBL fold metallo-hydrolase [Opitutaceae bacterium]|nr:MBL fold metallo-hydrolase [Opitutaceae bacterium]